MKSNDIKAVRRITVLDFFRGSAVALMVIYHTIFAIGGYFRIGGFWRLYLSIESTAPLFIATLFICACAVSSYLSKSNLRRGLKTLGAALIISFVTGTLLPLIGVEGLGVKFGILHLLSCAMLPTPFLLRAVQKIPAYIGVPVSLLLFLFTRDISKGYLGIAGLLSVNIPDAVTQVNYLFPFGIYAKGFFSADYYPIIPWIFIYTAGLWLGKAAFSREIPENSYKPIFEPIEFLGRNSLIIYLAHMPVIFLFGYLISLIA